MYNTGVDILWLAKCRYTYGQITESHAHRFYQYMYVLEGGGNITIGDVWYPFQKDHIYMIPAYTNHSFVIDFKEGLQTIEIKFVIENEELLSLANQLPNMMTLRNSIIKEKLEIMIVEGQETQKHYSDIINLNFCECLSRLFRLQEQENDLLASRIMKPLSTYDDDPLLQPVITYMKENIHENITLDDLAEIACLEKTYFSKKFKEKYGSSPIRFLNDIRLYQAKQLLKYSQMNITQISQRTGFQSLHYFSRFFAQNEGISPYEYRQKHSSNVYLYFIEEEKVNDVIHESDSASDIEA
jgi:AraC-like DNA-binding protein